MTTAAEVSAMSLLARLQEGPPSPLRQDVVDARLSWLAMGRGDPRVALGAAGWQEKMLDEMDAKHEIARADAMEEKKDTLVREIIEWDNARYGYFPRPTAGVSHDSRVERLNEVRCGSLPPGPLAAARVSSGSHAAHCYAVAAPLGLGSAGACYCSAKWGLDLNRRHSMLMPSAL